jgi:tetratricopeptide (TPR) repeat protein
LFFLCRTFIFSQPGNPSMVQWHKHIIDSLFVELKTAKEDSNKVDILHGIGFRYNRLAEYAEGIRYLNQSLSLAQKLNLRKREAKEYSFLGSLYEDMGNYPEALKNHQAALKIQEADNNIRGAGTSYNEIAGIYEKLGKYPEALNYLYAAMKNWKQTDNSDGVAFLNQNIASIYQRQGEYQQSLENYFTALKHWKKGTEVFDSIYVCDVSGAIGNVYIDIGNYHEALEYFSNALTIAQKIKKAVALITSYKNLGTLNSLQGNYAEGLKNYLVALKEAERSKNKPLTADIQNDIGNLYNSQDNYPEAFNYYWAALKIREEIGDKASMIRLYSNIGGVYARQNLFEDALKNQFAAKEISDQSGDKQGLIMSNHNIGVIYLNQAERQMQDPTKSDSVVRRLNDALKYQYMAMKFAEETGGKSDIANINVSIGSIFCKQASFLKPPGAKELYNKGLKYLNNGLTVAKEIGAKELVKDAYFELSEAYKGVNDYKNAFAFKTLYSQMNDSLINNETSKKIERLRLKYEIEKAQAEEKDRQEKIQTEMQFTFSKREDSLKYQQNLTHEQLKQQTLLTKQKEQTLLLKQASLDLSNKKNELNKLAYLKTQSELEVEQGQRKEKEQQLTIIEKEKILQKNQLALQQTQLNLKESQIRSERKQRLFYIGGIALLLLLFVFIYRNIKSRQRTEKLIAAERLKSEKASAGHKMAELELQSLRAQLNPHFMFNSLNAIQELILKEDNDNSHLYLSRFSELLRLLLDNANQPFVSLRKEISLLDLYLSLENLRIPDLKYSIEVDPLIDSNKVTIPNMMLQPYIENAIWHGLSHKKGEKNVSIRISKNENGILCEVEDNGVGRKIATELKSLYRKEHRSKGMELLSKRFTLLSREYGSDIRTTVEDLHDNGTATGTKVAITVPYSLTKQPEPAYS